MSHRLAVVLAGGLVAAAVTASPASSAPPPAARVSCGDTITADTTLHRDLVGCPNNGIIVGADGITISLNGHTIEGNGALVDPCPEGEVCDVGVVNSGGYNGVRIRGGSIHNFAVGVLVLRARDNALRHLAVTRNLYSGIILAETARSTVWRSTISRNGLTTDQAGMAVFASHHNRIRRNHVSANGDIGLFAVDSFNNNRIVNNTFADNIEAGMIVEGDENEVRRNRVRRNGDGMVSGGEGNVIAGNHIAVAAGCLEDNGDIGCGYGISIEGGADTTINGNIISHTRKAGIRLTPFGPRLVGTVVRGNVIRRAGTDGIFIDAATKRTLLRRNTARHANGDGIDVNNPTTRLAGNRAMRNGDLGIEAVRGVIDGGGNIARHNGDPRQCTHISCN